MIYTIYNLDRQLPHYFLFNICGNYRKKCPCLLVVIVPDNIIWLIS